MWKWFAGGRCLYSPIVAYFGTTQVCGQVLFVMSANADASCAGTSAVSASSQLMLNRPLNSLNIRRPAMPLRPPGEVNVTELPMPGK